MVSTCRQREFRTRSQIRLIRKGYFALGKVWPPINHGKIVLMAIKLKINWTLCKSILFYYIGILPGLTGDVPVHVQPGSPKHAQREHGAHR